jgi:hypothetical protein
MFAIWIIIGIANSVGVADAAPIWHWFGHHVFLTVLMLVFLA